MLEIVFVLCYFKLKMLKVDLDLLLQTNVAAYSSFKLLRLAFQRLIVMNADEVELHKLSEIVNKMVSQQSLVTGNFGILADGGQAFEIVFWREEGFDCIEDEVASMVVQILLGVRLLLQDVLKLF